MNIIKIIYYNDLILTLIITFVYQMIFGFFGIITKTDKFTDLVKINFLFFFIIYNISHMELILLF